MAQSVGKPLKYKTVLELETIVNLYFEECDPHIETVITIEKVKQDDGTYTYDEVSIRRVSKQQPYTMAGLARRLGLSRQALMEYKGRDKYGDAIKAARARVEEFNEHLLLSGKYATGAIFNLKVNFGYKENDEENKPPENPIVFVNMVATEPGES